MKMEESTETPSTLDQEEGTKPEWVRTKGASLHLQLCHLVMEDDVSNFGPHPVVLPRCWKGKRKKGWEVAKLGLQKSKNNDAPDRLCECVS